MPREDEGLKASGIMRWRKSVGKNYSKSEEENRGNIDLNWRHAKIACHSCCCLLSNCCCLGDRIRRGEPLDFRRISKKNYEHLSYVCLFNIVIKCCGREPGPALACSGGRSRQERREVWDPLQPPPISKQTFPFRHSIAPTPTNLFSYHLLLLLSVCYADLVWNLS
jgi:hypothetical protein